LFWFFGRSFYFCLALFFWFSHPTSTFILCFCSSVCIYHFLILDTLFRLSFPLSVCFFFCWLWLVFFFIASFYVLPYPCMLVSFMWLSLFISAIRLNSLAYFILLFVFFVFFLFFALFFLFFFFCLVIISVSLFCFPPAAALCWMPVVLLDFQCTYKWLRCFLDELKNSCFASGSRCGVYHAVLSFVMPRLFVSRPAGVLLIFLPSFFWFVLRAYTSVVCFDGFVSGVSYFHGFFLGSRKLRRQTFLP